MKFLVNLIDSVIEWMLMRVFKLIPIIALFALSGCATWSKQAMKVSCNTGKGPIGDLNLVTSNPLIIKAGSVMFVNDRGQFVEVKDAACGVSK